MAKPTDGQRPEISVFIATRNRAALLDQTLEHLARQTFPREKFEVIVADNGSNDGTAAVIDRWSTQLSLKTVVEPVPGKNRALNRALPLAEGSLYVFTDDDVVPAADWLSELAHAADHWPDDSIFGGRIVPQFPAQTPDFVRERSFPYAAWAFAWFEIDLPEGPMETRPFGPNLAIRGSVFDRFQYCETVGPAGKNYAMGSESELLRRLTAAGLRMIHVPTAIVQHVIEPHQVTLEWLKSRAYRAGRGRALASNGVAGTKWLGVPRYTWRKAAEAWVRSLACCLAARKTRWCAALDYQMTRGMIAELRNQARQEKTRLVRAADATGGACPN